MVFTEFVQLLYPVIGGASSQAAFVKTLFDIVATEDGQSVLEEQSESTYRSYFNGHTGISRIARKLNVCKESENFVQYIENFPEETLDNLCDIFSEHLPGIDNFNAGHLLAELFRTILVEAAGSKRKSSASSDDDTEPVEAEVVDGEMPSGSATNEQKVTVIQQQINVIQNGEKNFNLTNNGTMNFNI